MLFQVTSIKLLVSQEIICITFLRLYILQLYILFLCNDYMKNDI